MSPRNATVWAAALALAAWGWACSPPPGVYFRCEEGGACGPGYSCVEEHCLPVQLEDAGAGDAGEDGGEDGGTDGGDAGDGGLPDSGTDGGLDAGPSGPPPVPLTWGDPEPLEALNTSSGSERMPTVTPDQSKICFVASRSSSNEEIWCATKLGNSFTAPELQANLLPGKDTEHPELSADGGELFFTSDAGDYPDLLRATQSGASGFTGAEWVGDLAGPGYDTGPTLTGDGLTLIFQSDRLSSGGPNLHLATRLTAGSLEFSGVSELAELNSSADEREPAISPDGGYLVFTSDRPGAAVAGAPVLWLSVREEAGWSQPREVVLQGLTTEIQGLELAEDDTLYFQTRPQGEDADLYRARPVYPEP